MKMKRIWWGFLMIAAVAFLAGCGGGGGTSLMVGGERATQAAIDALETSLGTAQGDVERLTTDLETANMSATDLQADLNGANEMITMLNMQIAEAPTEARVTELTTMRDDYMKKATMYQTMLNTANDTITGLRADLVTANAKLDKFEDDIMAAEARNKSTMAKGFLEAMMTQDTEAMTPIDVKATRTAADGVTVLINPNEQDQSDYGSSERPVAPAITGWHGAALEAKGDSDSFPVVAVYTDVQGLLPNRCWWMKV